MGRLQNNPSIGWVHPKFTHGCPLTWAIKRTKNFGKPSQKTKQNYDNKKQDLHNKKTSTQKDQ
jgi:hypothetical protein